MRKIRLLFSIGADYCVRILMSRSAPRVAWWKLAALMSLAVVHAQYAVSARAGLVDSIEGAAFIDGTPVTISNTLLHLSERQRLSTGPGSRVQMLLGPNLYLWLGERASLTMNNSTLAEAEVVLEEGTAIVEATEEIKGRKARLRVGQSIITVSRRGVYRFDTHESILRVYGGEAEVSLGGVRRTVKRDKAVSLTPGLKETKFNRNQSDPLQLWAAERSFAAFAPSWRESNGKNWSISLSGTAHNDSFGAAVNSPAIVSEIRSRQVEDQKVRAEKARRDELDRKKRELEAQRQEQEERIRAQKQAAEAAAKGQSKQ